MELCSWPRCGCKARTICRIENGLPEGSPPENRKAVRKAIKRTKPVFDAELQEKDDNFYLSIWLTRPHFCQCGCNQVIPEMTRNNFHHLLEKDPFPEFRHEDWNIYLVTTDCHNTYHSNHDNRPVLKEARQSHIRRLESEGYQFSKYKINKKDAKRDRTVNRR